MAAIGGPGLAWDATYDEIGTWGRNPSEAVIKIIGMQPTPTTEAQLNQWYVERHIPQELDYPGVLGAARYRRVTEVPANDGFGHPYPRYLAMYFYEDLAAAEAWEASPQRAAAYADVTASPPREISAVRGPRPRDATTDPDRDRAGAELGRPQRSRKIAFPVGRRQWVELIAWR